VGFRKPDPRIFTRALEALGVQASSALMVGDNPFADIRGAAGAGMSTCWLAPLTRAVPEGCEPTFRIESLRELPDLLQRAPHPTSHAPQCTA
jgi:FMN phosphatase YigB (HAD superfamily)